MPIFAHGETKDKLSVLFFMRSADLDLMREQIHRAMVENECMSYFDFQTAMYEMEEDGLIAAIPRAFGQAYRVSARGEETLSMFEESLPFSLRERLQSYADYARDAMRLETQLQTSMEELPSGAYMVHLKAVEQDSVVLDISMKLASRSMAHRVRSNWEDASPEIYSYLLNNLLFTGKPYEEADALSDESAGEILESADKE